jgi:hypothetical protein
MIKVRHYEDFSAPTERNGGSDMITHKGIWYFRTEAAAAELAKTIPGNAVRIVEYSLGFAVQNGFSGEYLGPACLNPKEWKGV